MAEVAGSSGSVPASTVSRAAASATVRASGPAVSCAVQMGMMPVRLTRPLVGLTPTTPFQFGLGLTLRDGSREYYYTQLDRNFPGLKERTIRTCGSAYELRSVHHRELNDLFHRLCQKYGIWHDNDQIFRWMSRLEEPDQLDLFRQEAI